MAILPLRTSVPQRTPILTRHMAEMAAQLVKRAQPFDLSLHRALDRAIPRMTVMPWRVFNGGILEIASVSCPGETHQTDGTWCTCDSVYQCWHIAAWWIISTCAAAMCMDVRAALPLNDAVALDIVITVRATVLEPEPGTAYARITALVDELV